jgi:murein DD-endopeptidase MepM/ murein hydrolase activator NlpD
LQNATVGLRRLVDRLRSDLPRRSTGFVSTLGRRGIDGTADTRRQLARAVRPRSAGAYPARGGQAALRRARRIVFVAGTSRLAVARASVTPGMIRERLLPIAVACLVVVAAALSVGAGPSAASGVGNVSDGQRLVIGGESDGTWDGVDGPAVTGTDSTTNGVVDGADSSPVAMGDTDPALDPQAGPFLDDGTLVMPVAVDTTVDDGRAKLVTYKVKGGDTLTGIAHRFGVSMMTLWWANKLTDKDSLHIGQVLVIPPVTGLVITVAAGDTLASIAAKTGVPAQEILDASGITDPNLVIGQRLIIPGAKGAPIPTPKPTPKLVARSGGGGGTYHPPQTTYHGGKLAWPVPGGYISQYFHYSHPAIDIAAPYGSRILAAAAGTVIFAGWKNDGGGYQVWISHGSGLYTGYYHMSAVTVGVGEHVGRGEQIGRVGMTGNATGPHCHFEVWRGYPWESGSYRVNPLGYL